MMSPWGWFMSAPKVAIFGGAFDPISKHHERIAEMLGQQGLETWLMPCWGHMFAKAKRLAHADHRLKMVELVANQSVAACGWDIYRQHFGSMYDSMRELREVFPSHEFTLVIGMDNANIIETKWDRGATLIQQYPFIVFERAGETPTTDWFLKSPHKVCPLDYNLSSTAIREAIQQRDYDFAKEHLSLSVWDYIAANELYGYKS